MNAIPFTPGRIFRRQYRKLFKKDPAAANVLLLLAELADEHGQVHLGPNPEEVIAILMQERFSDPRAFQLPGGGKP